MEKIINQQKKCQSLADALNQGETITIEDWMFPINVPDTFFSKSSVDWYTFIDALIDATEHKNMDMVVSDIEPIRKFVLYWKSSKPFLQFTDLVHALILKLDMIVIGPTFRVEKLDMVVIGVDFHVEKLDTIVISEQEYPSTLDPSFNQKLTKYKDFNIRGKTFDPKDESELDALAEQLSNAPIELSTYQMLVRNFLSNETPYNGLLLYHGLGTGKTCSAITIAEEHRSFLKQSGLKQKIYILGGTNILSNFKNQLFNESHLVYKHGEWTCNNCIGNAILREINPSNQPMNKSDVVTMIEDVIKQHYKFMGYIEFSNMVADKYMSKLDSFENAMIIIDEVHNIKEDDKTDQIKTSQTLDLITDATTVKLLLLSATPMFNDAREIVWILNLLNRNDKKPTIHERDFFNQGALIESKKEEFIDKIRGYVSFVKGENPYTFPYRVYPQEGSIQAPTISLTTQGSFEPLKAKVFYVQLGEFQMAKYKQSITESNIAKLKSSFTMSDLDKLSSALNMTYPSTHKTSMTSYMIKKGDRYKYPSGGDRCFDLPNLKKYSAKIYSICNHVRSSTGIVLIYTKLISNGLIPISMALESMGYNRCKGKNNFLTEKTMNGKQYCIMTGTGELSDTQETISVLNSDANKYGEQIKVVIITNAASEGVDFKNIRQIHIVDPWWHLNRIEQIIGRGIRWRSHKALPFRERNAQIFLYVAVTDETETIDHFLYRYSEKKALKIGKVSRLLKENAIDCAMNHAQIQAQHPFTIKQLLSDGSEIDYQLNNQSFSVMCDFMECEYTCNYESKEATIEPTLFNTSYSMEQIRKQFRKGYIYSIDELYVELNLNSSTSWNQMYDALDQLIELKSECKDMFNRPGYIINRGKYYLFQPKHLPESSTVYERRIPNNFANHAIVETPEEPVVEKNIDEILLDMKKKYDISQRAYELAVGTDWYELVPQIVPLLQKHSFKNKKPPIVVVDKDIQDCVIQHMIEMLNYKECLQLVHYLFSNKLDDFQTRLKNYFKPIQHGKNTFLKLWNDTTVELLKKTDRGWEPYVGFDEDDVKTYSFGPVVGGIANKTSEIRTLKTKRLVDETSTGQVCENASLKGSVVASIIPRLEEILGDTYPTLTRDKACCIMEMLLRILQMKHHEEKTWFLNAIEVIELNNADSIIKLLKARGRIQ